MTAQATHKRAGLLVPAVMLALALAIAGWPRGASAQRENLVDRISNEQMREFEQQMTDQIRDGLSRYIGEARFVVSVKVIWEKDVIPKLPSPGVQPGKQKLPGFPVFVRSPDAPAVDETTPSFVRMVVKVLLDESLPEYYERFTRKLVPIVARFDESRGDQVIVLKETFPQKARQAQPATVPEDELMERLPEMPEGPPSTAPSAPAGPAEEGMEPAQEAQVAYDEGRYTDALRVARQGFQRATSNRERARFLSIEGSVYYTMQNYDAAREAWRRALVFDPGNEEVHRMLNFMEQRQQSGSS